MRFTRRHLLAALGGAALFSGLRYGHLRIARPAEPSGPLSDQAKALIARAWQGLDPQQVLDTHVHVVGLGEGGTGCKVGERMKGPGNPLAWLKYDIYLRAAGILDEQKADQQYVERLTSLVRSEAPHGRLLLLAFDQAYTPDGKVDEEQTEFYTPNEYVLKLAKDAPDCFVPAASVHPYRADAVEALEAAVEAGAVAVKWLPNAMGMDPSSEKCDALYEAMARLQVPLITHAGEEKAVNAEERQRLGNPLHLRRALEHGVTVVVAHCASLGQNPDLDKGKDAPWVDNFELFLRLMGEKQWEGKLFADVSAVTQVNRLGPPLRKLLTDPALQRRCINGSDYPLPAINVLMSTEALVRAGVLTEAERALINEIDQHDPLLFDFVVKRTVKVELEGQVHRFADDVFTARPEVFPRLARPA